MYRIVKVLGEGYSGEVTEVIDKKGDKYAIKKIANHKKAKREIFIHSSLDHPNIVKFIYHNINLEDISIIMELCEENLQDSLDKLRYENKELDVADALTIFGDLCAAIFYMHGKGFVHRDIKPENLLKKGKIWKLCDFGFSDSSSKSFGKVTGTPEFIAPEAIINDTYFGMPADIWAMGICFYEMLYLECPFTDNHISKIYRKIRKGEFRFKNRKIGENLENLINLMLTFDFEKRICIEVLYTNVIAQQIIFLI